MEQRTFNQLLAAAVKNGASDIHIKAGAPPALRISGSLLPVKVPALMPEDTENIAKFILVNARWKGDVHELRVRCALDCRRQRAQGLRQRGAHDHAAAALHHEEVAAEHGGVVAEHVGARRPVEVPPQVPEHLELALHVVGAGRQLAHRRPP